MELEKITEQAITIGGKLQPALEQLSEKMGVGVEKLYEIGMREILFKGIANGVSGILFLILGIIGIFLLKSGFKITDNDTKQFCFTLLGIFGVVIGFLLGIADIYNCLHYLINPEFMLFKEILTLI